MFCAMFLQWVICNEFNSFSNCCLSFYFTTTLNIYSINDRSAGRKQKASALVILSLESTFLVK